MDSDAVIKEEIHRLGIFAESPTNPNRTITHISNHILNDYKLGKFTFPIYADELVTNTMVEGWFQTLFYYYSIAELVVVGAFTYQQGVVNEGPEIQKWLNWSGDFENRRLEAVKNQDLRNRIHAEGIEYIKNTFIPKELHGLLREYPKGWCRVNAANREKRVVEGAEVIVVFGKTTTRFASSISNVPEFASYQGYIKAHVIDKKKGKVVIGINQEPYEVESWSVTHCKR